MKFDFTTRKDEHQTRHSLGRLQRKKLPADYQHKLRKGGKKYEVDTKFHLIYYGYEQSVMLQINTSVNDPQKKDAI